MARSKRQQLAIFRLRDAGSRAKQPLRDVVVDDPKLRSVDANVSSEWSARAFVRTTEPAIPKWATFLADGIEDLAQLLKPRAANSLLLVLKKGKTRYALAFGHGRALLNPRYIERGFGLRCALALIEPESMVSATFKQIDHTTLFSKVQANVPVGFDGFRIDTEAALVGGVLGHPADKHIYYSRTFGEDALHLNPAIKLSQLPKLLKWAEDVHKKKDYLARGFDFVDHVSVVKDPVLVAKLRSAIDKSLRGKGKSVGVGLPEFVEHLAIDAFKLTGLGRERLDRVSLSDLVRAVGSGGVSCDELASKKIRAVGDDKTVLRTWSAFSWLTWSGKLKGESFHLQDGVFYRVAQPYENRIDRYLRKIEQIPTSWPDLTALDEAEWNQKLERCLGKKAKLMDKVLFGKSFRGPGKIEFCDVFLAGSPNWLICAKIYDGSAPLSHLFAQGANAIETLFADEGFRQELRKVSGLKSRIKAGSPKKDAFGLAYVILFRGRRRSVVSLPFFAKLTLYRYAKLLGAAGFRLCIGCRSMN